MNAADLPIPDFPHLQKYGVKVEPWLKVTTRIPESYSSIDSVDWSQPPDRLTHERTSYVLRIHGDVPAFCKPRRGETRWCCDLTLDEYDVERNATERLTALIRVKAECAELAVLDLLGELPESKSA